MTFEKNNLPLEQLEIKAVTGIEDAPYFYMRLSATHHSTKVFRLITMLAKLCAKLHDAI